MKTSIVHASHLAASGAKSGGTAVALGAIMVLMLPPPGSILPNPCDLTVCSVCARSCLKDL